MRDNSGVTLMSVMIYVIGMTIVLGLMATLVSFFYNNVDVNSISNNSSTQYTKFSSVFVEEINRENNYIIDCKSLGENNDELSYIIFSSGNQYTFMRESGSVYKNNVRICDGVEECDFSYSFVDSKYFVKVNFRTEGLDLSGENAVVYNF